MKKLFPKIDGSFHIDLTNFPKVTVKDMKDSLEFFLKSQYPSGYRSDADKLSFWNNIFRFRVNRGRNYLRGFNKGHVSLRKEENVLYIEYSGTLYRGVFIAAIQALIAFGIFSYFAAGGWWIGFIIFIMGYLFNVVITHTVFPMWLAKHIHTFLSENEE